MGGFLNPQYERNRWVIRGRLGRNGDANYHFGAWGRLTCLRPFTVTVGSEEESGLIGSVQLYVANSLTEPPRVTQPLVLGAAPLGPPITIPQALTFDLPYEWIAVIISPGQRTIVDLAAG
jgi:hypothetical protein